MLPSMTLSLALLVPGAPIPKDTAPAPVGPAPHVVYLAPSPTNAGNAANAAPPPGVTGKVVFLTRETTKVQVPTEVTKVVDGKQVVEKVMREVQQTVMVSKALGERNETFVAVDGTKLTLEEVNRRLKDGATVLISADGKPVESGWLRVASKDTIAIASLDFKDVFPLGQLWRAKPAPRLVRLVPDANGKVRVATVPARPTGGNSSAPVILPAAKDGKPLEDVAFDAYTANGESVTKVEALRRLASGGIVLVAGSNVKPDGAYLKAFAPDLLVLVSAELALPNGGFKFHSGPLGGRGPMPPIVRAVPQLR